jgi:plasmid stability protein
MVRTDDPPKIIESAPGDIMLSNQPVPETVAQLLVRQLDDDLKARLKRRAARHGLSMEEAARRILRQALEDEGAPRAGLGSRIAARFARTGLDAPVPELRGQRVRPPDFGQ